MLPAFSWLPTENKGPGLTQRTVRRQSFSLLLTIHSFKIFMLSVIRKLQWNTHIRSKLPSICSFFFFFFFISPNRLCTTTASRLENRSVCGGVVFLTLPRWGSSQPRDALPHYQSDCAWKLNIPFTCRRKQQVKTPRWHISGRLAACHAGVSLRMA